MNTTAPSGPTPAAEVPLSRAEKEVLLRQMYSLAHWIELIRFFGYQTFPMDRARQAIKPLAEQYGKEPVASACEALIEILTEDKEAFARLKPQVCRMAFQILGPKPSQDAPAPADSAKPQEQPDSAPMQPVSPKRTAKTKTPRKKTSP